MVYDILSIIFVTNINISSPGTFIWDPNDMQSSELVRTVTVSITNKHLIKKMCKHNAGIALQSCVQKLSTHTTDINNYSFILNNY